MCMYMFYVTNVIKEEEAMNLNVRDGKVYKRGWKDEKEWQSDVLYELKH